MSRTLMRRIVSGAALSFLSLGLLGAPALAGAEVDPSNFGYNNTGQYFGASKTAEVNTIIPGGAYKDPRELTKNIINVVLGFLGIIAVVIILMAGFQWMTAGGEEEKVTEARQRLIQGAIGLVLILAAWIVAYFIIDQLVKAIHQG